MPYDDDEIFTDDSIGSESWTPLYRANMELGEYLHNALQDVQESFFDEFPTTISESKCREEEYSVGQFEAHKKYMELTEQVFQNFLEREGVSESQFFQQCRESLEGKYCALFEEDINEPFVRSVLSILDFEQFYRTMMRGSRAKLHK